MTQDGNVSVLECLSMLGGGLDLLNVTYVDDQKYENVVYTCLCARLYSCRIRSEESMWESLKIV